MAQRILLVEDEELLRDIYHEVLEDEGYEVDVAVDGEQAEEYLSQGGYDLVLLDVMLPKRDGKQVAAELKEHPAKRANKNVVWMTNLADEKLQSELAEFSVQGIVVKSAVTPEEFLEKVKSYL